MATSVWPGGDSGFFAALAGHTALALEADFVFIARLNGPSYERVQTVAVIIEGEPGEDSECSRRDTFREEALAASGWICTEAQRYDALHPALGGVVIRASL